MHTLLVIRRAREAAQRAFLATCNLPFDLGIQKPQVDKFAFKRAFNARELRFVESLVAQQMAQAAIFEELAEIAPESLAAAVERVKQRMEIGDLEIPLAKVKQPEIMQVSPPEPEAVTSKPIPEGWITQWRQQGDFCS